jgi:Bacterial TSP3 repeat
VTFRLLSTNTTLFGPRFELLDPQGRALNGAGGTSFTGTLTNAGDYTLLVYQNTGTSQTGNYWLSAERLKAPCDIAMLACGMVVTNTISDLGEFDLFTFAVAAPPVVTRFRLESVTASFTATMELYDPLGRSAGANASSITGTLTNAGTHTLLVTHNGSSSVRTGAYRVIVEQITPACSPLTLVCGDTVAGSISSSGEADFYEYVATAGEFVTFRLTGTNATLFAPRLELFDPLGRSVAVSGNTTFTGTLTNTGSYVLVVSYNTGSSRVGSYWLAVERLVNPCVPAALGCGVLQTNSLGLGGLEVLTFAIATNEAVTLRLSSLTAGFTPGLELYDPTGRVVTAAGALTYSGTLSNAGNYTLVVRYASGTTREGVCTVYRQSLKIPCGALPLVCGELTDDWLEAGGLAAYFFSGATGDVVTLRFASTSFPTPTMEVFDPDGTSLTASSFAVSRTLTKTGNYLVLVQSGGTVPTIQDYQIVFQNLRVPCASVPLVCGQVQAGRISANGEVQTYSFTTVPGERLRLQLGNNSQFFSALLDLFDAAGAVVASGVTSWTGVSTNGGPYAVLVRWNANDNSRIGDYLLSYQRVPNPCDAQPLTVGTRVRGTLEVPVEMDSFTFTAAPGPITLCFTMSGGSGQMELYSPTGATLGASGFQIQTNLPSAGVYTVLVRSTFGSGDYTLTLRSGFVSCSTIDSFAPYVYINTPAPDEFVARGSNVLINWYSDDGNPIVRHEVRLSTDGGLTFPTQLADLPGNVFDFIWAVPAGPSVGGWRLRVLATDSGGNIGFGDTEISTMVINPGEVATNSFYYDALDQLTGAGYDANTFFSFTYDSARNRTGVAVIEDPNADSDNDGIPNGWESQYGLDPHDPADAALDLDGDGATNLQEFLAGTDPSSAASVFLVTDVARIDASTISVTFLSIPGRDYVLERTDDLGSGFWFEVDYLQAFGPVSTALDVNAFGLEQAFYRVRLDTGGGGGTVQ